MSDISSSKGKQGSKEGGCSAGSEMIWAMLCRGLNGAIAVLSRGFKVDTRRKHSLKSVGSLQLLIESRREW